MSFAPVLDSARLAWWVTAWLRGMAGPDDVRDAVLAGDAAHDLIDLPGEEALPLLLALPALRRAGAWGAGLALPAPGHPAGLGGPPPFNRAALDAGEAVVLLGADLGLVPHRAGAGVVWTALPAARRPLLDLGDASRGLRRALHDVATELARLDVARWNPDVADALMNLRHREALEHPAGVPAAAVDLAMRAQQALEIVELALSDDGAAVSALEATARRTALDGLARAARDAWVAAGSPDAWPPDA